VRKCVELRICCRVESYCIGDRNQLRDSLVSYKLSSTYHRIHPLCSSRVHHHPPRLLRKSSNHLSSIRSGLDRLRYKWRLLDSLIKMVSPPLIGHKDDGDRLVGKVWLRHAID
jgi:hypothetical protein